MHSSCQSLRRDDSWTRKDKATLWLYMYTDSTLNENHRIRRKHMQQDPGTNPHKHWGTVIFLGWKTVCKTIKEFKLLLGQWIDVTAWCMCFSLVFALLLISVQSLESVGRLWLLLKSHQKVDPLKEGRSSYDVQLQTCRGGPMLSSGQELFQMDL